MGRTEPACGGPLRVMRRGRGMATTCAVASGVLLGAAAPAVAQTAPAAQRPNFLFIYTDDQRWDAMGCVQREQGERARFPWFRTPNMDRLAAEGVRFRNAFVTSALCAPSRACFLTGRYNHENGVASNFRPFPMDSVTHATQLRAAGYATAYVGKWHMGSQRERPGFDFAASYIAHGRYNDSVFVVDGKDTPTRGWVDDVATDYAIDFLRRQKGSGKPWSVVVGFKSPHDPREPPPRSAGLFPDAFARPVPNLNAAPPYREGAKKTPVSLEASARLPVDRKYFQTLAAIDDDLGRLLNALDELKMAENTVVIYTSDNGYYLGEHSSGDKRSAYEESMRIPLIVRYPRLAAKGGTVDEMTLNVDLAPTLLDLAGVPIPQEMQGRSWRPLLEGRPAPDWRRSFFYEYFWERQPGSPPNHTAVRTPAAKLIRYQGQDAWTELFDLAKDPYETRNLYADPAAATLRREMEAEYERQRQAVGYVVPPYVDDPAALSADKPLDAWVLDFRFDQIVGDTVADASGRKHAGKIEGASPADGRAGAKAFRFGGDAYVDVPKSPNLNPGVKSWTVEATFKAEQPDGVVLAQGGASNGYSLALEDGKPVFTVVGEGRRSRVVGSRPVTDTWATVKAGWSGDTLTLSVDGGEPSRAKVSSPLLRLPMEGLQIGADRGTTVGEKTLPGFRGLIERVRIYSGEMP